MEYRKCSKCGEEKPLTNKYFHSRGNGSFRKDCIICRKKYLDDYRIKNSEKLREKKKEYRESNHEVIVERKKKYYQENKERINNHNKENYEKNKEKYSIARVEYVEKNKEKIYAKNKEYREKNREKIRQIDNAYKNANKDKIRAKQKEYYQSDIGKEKHNIVSRRYSKTDKGRITSQMSREKRRMTEMNVLSTLTKEQWEYCKEYFQHTCVYCGKTCKRLEQDHFIPISKSGIHTANNIVCACKSCNSSKRDREPYEWFSQKPFFTQERYNKIINYLKIRI